LEESAFRAMFQATIYNNDGWGRENPSKKKKRNMEKRKCDNGVYDEMRKKLRR
jgi:hypothetical protein